jgi:hypothetical protein
MEILSSRMDGSATDTFSRKLNEHLEHIMGETKLKRNETF